MAHRKLRSVRKKGELPSFLLNLTAVPEDLNVLPRGIKSKQHLGPIFFGECQQFHPPLHELDLGGFRHIQHSHVLKETIDDLFRPKPEVKKCTRIRKEFHPFIKHEKFYSDPYPHKCPGVRKAFVPELKPTEVDLGNTTSVIEGETSMEVSLYRLKRVSSTSPETELEIISPSDLREEKLKDMPYKKRIAHPHFPKRFATVNVIGPTIPAAITITKLPTKRKTSYGMNLLFTSQEGERVGEADENKEETVEEVTEAESGANLLVEEEMEELSEHSSVDEVKGTGEVEEGNDLQEFSEGGISAEPEEEVETMNETKEEETAQETKEEDLIGVDITHNDIDENSVENQNKEELED